MAKAIKKNWIVGICCTEADGVRLERVYGTANAVKRYLVKCVKEDRLEDSGAWDYGITKVSEVAGDGESWLYAYAVYSSYHIDYSAVVEEEPIVL